MSISYILTIGHKIMASIVLTHYHATDNPEKKKLAQTTNRQPKLHDGIRLVPAHESLAIKLDDIAIAVNVAAFQK